nr:hypothetical protein [Pseudomonas sp. Irchel s3b2]
MAHKAKKPKPMLNASVSDTNPVHVVDVFVNELDLVKLGFEGVIPADTFL